MLLIFVHILLPFIYFRSHSVAISHSPPNVGVVNNIFESVILPNSRYKLHQLFNDTKNTKFYGTCSNCNSLLGNLDDIKDQHECENCHNETQFSTPSSDNVFAVIDPSDRISEILMANEDYYDKIMNNRPVNPDKIEDIFDGVSAIKNLEKKYQLKILKLT